MESKLVSLDSGLTTHTEKLLHIHLEPKPKPRYKLAELMAQCDFSEPLTKEEQEWLDAPLTGHEDI